MHDRAISLVSDCVTDKRARKVTLCHFLLSRICRSSDPSVSIRCNHDISRGSWAGHRFDIVPPTALIDMRGDSTRAWKNISVQVALEIYDVWADDGFEMSSRSILEKKLKDLPASNNV